MSEKEYKMAPRNFTTLIYADFNPCYVKEQNRNSYARDVSNVQVRDRYAYKYIDNSYGSSSQTHLGRLYPVNISCETVVLFSNLNINVQISWDFNWITMTA